MVRNNKTIWETILLKNVKGANFQNVKTIPDIDGALQKKYQVFEVLVAETLAKIRPEVKWEITYGSKDDGIDIKGIYLSSLRTPFTTESPQALILGQIKRRNKGYRFDHFRTDIDKMFEYYSNHCLKGNQSLFQLLFVISTDNINNIINLRNDLEEEKEQKRHVRFIANISSPICLIDAMEIIRYWKLNFNFVKNIIENIFTSEEIELFSSYLSDINVEWISINIEHNDNRLVNVPFEYRIIINSDIKNIPLDIMAEWRPNDEEKESIQLLYPLKMVSFRHKGLQLRVTNSYTLPMMFRSLQDGMHNLGSIIFRSSDGAFCHETSLGSVLIRNTLFPVYQVKPNKHISEALEKEINNTTPECVAYALTGLGGIGKSSLISDIMVRAANKLYLCIDVQNPKGFQDDIYILHEILKEIYRNHIHDIFMESKFVEYTQIVLENAYDSKWEPELYNFFEKKDFNTNVIVECFVTILLKALHYENIFIWLSDMHWISEQTGEVLRKIICALKNNSDYLEHKVLFLMEGRSGEKLLYNHKYYIPYAWDNFLIKTEVIHKEMEIWKLEDSKKFIISLLQASKNQIGLNKSQEKILNLLLRYTNGIPMHIVEQLKYLINCEKAVLKSDGTVFVVDPNCENLFSNDITQLIRARMSFFHDKYTDFVDCMILFANLFDCMTLQLSNYLIDLLHERYVECESIFVEIGIGTLDGPEIHFQHEYYINVLRNIKIKNQDLLENCLKWVRMQKDFDINLSFCSISLCFLMKEIDYNYICQKITILQDAIKTDKHKKMVYEYLCKIPNVILKKYNYKLYKIYFELAQMIIQSGNWNLAAEYLRKILDDVDEDCQEYHYYKALAYQDLSNILSGQLFLDESIRYASDGIEDVREALLKYPQNSENLKMVEELLIERLAICQLFSGDINSAVITQEQAYQKALARNNSYTKLRIEYEKGDVLLHKNLIEGIKILEQKYQESLNCDMLFIEEPSLIHAMELVGKLLKAWHETDLSAIQNIYDKSMELDILIKNKGYNYGASINLQTAACANLYMTNDIESTIPLFMKSLEKAVDANLDELLWKCYLNISQCYQHIGAGEEATLYAQKCINIIDNMLQQNPKVRPQLERLFQHPIECLRKIVADYVPKCIYDTYCNIYSSLEIHYVKWNECSFFIMN
jgi:hypothetical protein